MKNKKILSLTFIILLSSFRYALTETQQSSTSTLSERVTVESENYDTLETLIDYFVDAMQLFDSAFSNITNVLLYQNGDPLEASFELKNSNYSISFSDVIFSTAQENFICVSKIIIIIGSTLMFYAAPLPDKTITLTGRVNVTDLTTPSSLRDGDNSVGRFNVTFVEPSFQKRIVNMSEAINDLTIRSSFGYKGFEIGIHDVQDSYRSLVLKSIDEIKQHFVSSLRTKMDRKFIELLQTRPIQAMYNLSMNHSKQITTYNRSFASFEESYYYLVADGSELTLNDSSELSFRKGRLAIDSIRLNGLQPTLVSVICDRNRMNKTHLTWDTVHHSPLMGYAYCHYYASENDSGIFEKLNFKIPHFILDGSVNESTSYISTNLYKSHNILLPNTTLPAFAWKDIEDMIRVIIEETIKNAYDRKLQPPIPKSLRLRSNTPKR